MAMGCRLENPYYSLWIWNGISNKSIDLWSHGVVLKFLKCAVLVTTGSGKADSDHISLVQVAVRFYKHGFHMLICECI